MPVLDQPLNYQWQFNGTNLNGRTNSLLELQIVSADQAGAYRIVMTAVANGQTNSWYGPAANVAITNLASAPPFIITQPGSQTVGLGASTAFKVQAGGTPPLMYEWLVDGATVSTGGDVSGVASPTLTFTNISASDRGVYSAIVSNSFGAVTSSVVTLAVLAAAAPGLLLAPMLTSGQIRFTVSGAAGLNYVVQTSTNMASTNWMPLFTNSVPFVFWDTNTSASQQFYRAIPQSATKSRPLAW